MKKFRFKFLSAYNVLLTCILSLLGFATSCDPMVEYGTPNAAFLVNGKVTSEQSGEGISNIKIVMRQDSAYTDSQGNYGPIHTSEFPLDQTFSIQFLDIDGDENGSYSNLDTIIEFKDPQFIDGDGHWYSGETIKDFNIELKEKK